MDLQIDLDDAAAALSERLSGCPDLEVGELTWKDMDAAYDAPFATERGQIQMPYSVGVQVRRGDEEGLLVLYAGGGADLEYWSGSAEDEPILRVPGWDDWLDVPRFAEVVDDFLALFRKRA